MERPVSRRRAALPQGRRRHGVAVAARLVGSPDIYGHKEREAEQSINFVTCHDGFTLNDLVSLQREAQRGQRRGQSRRRQRQPELELRRRRADRRSGDRSAAQPPGEELPRARRCCRAGTPMLLMGDEVRRTQQRQQQRLLPGRRDQLVRLGLARAARRHPPVREGCPAFRPAARRGDRRRPRSVLNRAPGRGADRMARRRDWNVPIGATASHSLAVTLRSLRERFLFHGMFNAYGSR